MRDMLPEDLEKRQFVIRVIRDMFKVYGYSEIATPVIESFELLSAKIGEEIRQRMYTFTDMGGRRVALRPEMTAPVARLVATKLRTAQKPLRLGYIANCFRYDNPQLGRYREFWQAGFELFGSGRPEADAEILIISADMMKRLGFLDYRFKIGQVEILHGVLNREVSQADQNNIMSLIDKGRRTAAIELLTKLKVPKQDVDVIKKLFQLKGNNVAEILSKGETVLSNYDASYDALVNLKEILEITKASGAEFPTDVDLGFARGLEYYTGIIFETYVPKLNIALNGGGRYDKLVETFGGEPTPGVGCAPGIDRIALAMEKGDFFPKKAVENRILIVPVGDGLRAKAFTVAASLIKSGLSAEVEVQGRGVKKALSYANAKGCSFVVIVGLKELERGNLTVRDMKKEAQEEVPVGKVVEWIWTSLKRLGSEEA